MTRIAGGSDGRRHQPLAQAERIENARGVGRQLDAGAGFLELVRLLEHGDAQAGARHGQRGGQAGDAGAGDDHMTRRRHGGSGSIRRFR